MPQFQTNPFRIISYFVVYSPLRNSRQQTEKGVFSAPHGLQVPPEGTIELEPLLPKLSLGDLRWWSCRRVVATVGATDGGFNGTLVAWSRFFEEGIDEIHGFQGLFSSSGAQWWHHVFSFAGHHSALTD